MITYDPSQPTVLRVDPDSTEEVLAALAAQRPVDGSDQVDAEVLGMFATVLSAPRGALRLESVGAEHYVAHEFTLAAQGSLRVTRGRDELVEIGLFPTQLFSGVLLRLLQLAPVEPLPAEVRVTLPAGLLDEVLTENRAARTAPLATLQEAGASLPPARDARLEQAPLRVHRLVRRDDAGDRTAQLVMLRGRYLRVESGAFGTALVGTDPTGAHRVMSDLLNPRR